MSSTEGVPLTSTTRTSAPARQLWHGIDVETAAGRLGVDVAAGLAPAEAGQRLAEHGPNRLAEPKRRSRLLLFLDQFKSFLIVVLIGAAALAALVGDVKDMVVVTVVLLLNATLGYVQENRAEESMQALRRMLAWRVRARRGGQVVEVASADVVPGDLVLLDAGDRVPADGRIVSSVNLAIDESALTGESHSVDKTTAPVAPDAAVADRTCMAYMNSVVTRGKGEMLVTATGMDTEIGAIAGMLAVADSERTPLQRQLDVLGKRLAAIAGVAVSLVLVLAIVQGTGFVDALLDAVALAIAAIPEGLPAVVTVTLAVGVSQMAKRSAIVRRLASVETLGATSVICSDKTGTLTLNQMTARRVLTGGNRRVEAAGTGYAAEGELTENGRAVPEGSLDHLLVPIALCTDASFDDGELVGEPTDGALTALAAKGGVDVAAVRTEWTRLAEIPFDSAAKFMATFCATPDGEVLVSVKGAPDVLATRCRDLAAAGPDHDDAIDGLASDGLRVLAVATRRCKRDELDAASGSGLDDLARDLQLQGLVGILDPPRPEVKHAIALCRSAGIEVKMITGDHAATAAAIAAELGIEGRVVTGADLDALDDDALAAVVDDIAVCARVRPQHKVRIVAAQKSHGHVVAMTGDGVNDAPALKNADIGVAMGITGTEVTKEAADMVLTDDNFATIVGAVERGRTLYENISTFVRFQLGTNFGALMTILAASIAGLPTPLTAIQILWVNLIMDGPPAMALGVDPPRPGVMDQKPRDPAEQILSPRRVGRLLFVGSVMMVGTIAMFQWGRHLEGDGLGTSLAFTTFVLFQVFNALGSRQERESVFGSHTFTNRWLWVAIVAVLALQLVVVQVPAAASVFDTEPLTATQWGICLAVASSLLWVEEARKLVLRHLPVRDTRRSGVA